MKKYFTKNNTPLIIFGILLAIGIFIRLWHFEDYTTFLGDQGRDAIIIRNLAQFKDIPLRGPASSIGAVHLGPMYYYLMTPFLWLFWFNPTGIAYGICLLSIAGIIGTYLVIKREINPYTAVFLTFFLTFAYHLVDFSRNAWNPNLVPVVSFLSLYYTYLFIKREKVTDAIILGALLSINTQLHYLTFLLMIPIAIVWIYRVCAHSEELKTIRNVFIAAVTFIVLYIPFIKYEMDNNFPNWNGLMDMFSNNQIITTDRPYIERFLETNRYFFQNILHVETVNQWLALGVFAAVIALGIIATKKYKAHFLIMLNTMSFILYILLFSMMNSPRHAHYYGAIYFSFYLIVAYAISLIPHKIAKYVVTGVVIVAFLYITIPKYFFFKDIPSRQTERARIISASFKDRKFDEPIRFAALPATEQMDQYSYFVGLDGVRILPYSSKEVPKELYVICLEECSPVDDPIWPIADFQDRKEVESWEVKGMMETFNKKAVVHRIIHSK